jgi:hypothetical protein
LIYKMALALLSNWTETLEINHRLGCGPQADHPPHLSYGRSEAGMRRAGQGACYVVRDARRTALAYVYCESEPGRRSCSETTQQRRGAAPGRVGSTKSNMTASAFWLRNAILLLLGVPMRQNLMQQIEEGLAHSREVVARTI